MGAVGKQFRRGKSVRIARRLRARIVCGDWEPGDRLPVRTELEREFATTPATIQKAVDVLLRDELLVTRGCNGTFVSDRLPHRHRVGVVFPCDPAQPDRWHRLYAAVDDEAQRLGCDGDHDLRMYYGLDDPESPGRVDLLSDISCDRLAGLFIVAMSLKFFEGTPVLGHRYLRVAAMSGDADTAGVMPVVFQRLLPSALEVLRDLGRRKVALIYSPQAQRLPGELQAALPQHGMTSHPNWCVPAWPSTPAAARTGAYLLLRQPEGDRPDAIVVADDYLVEQTTLGVLDAGMRAPDDVTVLAQCNFPHLPPAVTPIVRLGYDLPAMLDHTVTALLAPELPARITVPLLGERQWRAAHPVDLPASPSPVPELIME